MFFNEEESIEDVKELIEDIGFDNKVSNSIKKDNLEYNYDYDLDKSFASEKYIYNGYFNFSFNIIHKGLTLNEMINELEKNHSYNIYFTASSSIFPEDIKYCINLKEYKGEVFELVELHKYFGSFVLDFLLNFEDYYYVPKTILSKFYNDYLKSFNFYFKTLNESVDNYSLGEIIEKDDDFKNLDFLVDESDKLKSSRFLIVSDSKLQGNYFKVLDIFSYEDYYQIILLHLPSNLECFFKEDNMEAYEDLVKSMRKLFIECFN
ncbi:hypothetical protein BGI41_07025 [Methanobrevibacter sp. 87.7]|uniref:hypothetical protein n=1 Tax=Methanobrevibacter sp. 87.7 TaxID=387957 RepID=UPI000B50DA75|nr:hypothetical protein [Methanobrevibacter sp. 87.7]OWT32561.1 hypothetical protein BGI41_07025 [Methanobrevibacter sp. 87.7]